MFLVKFVGIKEKSLHLFEMLTSLMEILSLRLSFLFDGFQQPFQKMHNEDLYIPTD